MQSRWNLTYHWPTLASQGPYPYVTIEGEDPYTKQHFAVVVLYDLGDRGVSLKGVSALPTDSPVRPSLRHKPADALTSNLLRMLPIDPIRTGILAKLTADPSLLTPVSLWARIVEAQGGTATDEELAYFRAARRSVEVAVADATDPFRGARPKRGRGAVNDEFYAHIAESYLDLHPKFGQKCVKAMAEELDTTPQQVSEWVRRSRKLGWLTKAPKAGQAGGQAGFRLLHWRLEQEET